MCSWNARAGYLLCAVSRMGHLTIGPARQGSRRHGCQGWAVGDHGGAFCTRRSYSTGGLVGGQPMLLLQAFVSPWARRRPIQGSRPSQQARYSRPGVPSRCQRRPTTRKQTIACAFGDAVASSALPRSSLPTRAPTTRALRRRDLVMPLPTPGADDYTPGVRAATQRKFPRSVRGKTGLRNVNAPSTYSTLQRRLALFQNAANVYQGRRLPARRTDWTLVWFACTARLLKPARPLDRRPERWQRLSLHPR